MNREFAEKMIKAKQMEMEAIGCLMPEPVRSHIDVINRELKGMAKDMVVCCCTGSGTVSGTGGDSGSKPEEKHKTSKVDIE